MAPFIFFAALLAILAVALAVSALWQRSRALALALAIGLPLAAAGVYQLKGNPAATKAVAPAASAPAPAPTSLEDLVAQLQKKQDAEPGNYDGMVLLARSYMALERFDLARETYAKAVKLKPEETDLQVEYAEAMLRAAGDHRFPPEAVTMLETAIAKNPTNQRALFFLGTCKMQENKPADAVAIWEKLLPLLDGATAQELSKQIDVARRAAGMPPLPPAPKQATGSAATTALDIDVRIDPTLATAAKPGDVLFVFARAVDGSGPPLAAKRIEIFRLPLHVQLSDADSPMPAARLSSQRSVMVMARLSKSGNVQANSGDIEADPHQVSVGDGKAIILVLNRPVP